MTAFPWPAHAPLFGSGTHALVALVLWGARRHGWRRAWLPSYYCPEVPAGLRSLEAHGIELLTYPDHDLTGPPATERIGAAPGDVIVVANQLGVRPRPVAAGTDEAGHGPAAGDARVATARPATAPGTILVEDHSHDPGSAWARGSRADYAFASLRKTLPLPDGGAVWSPQGLELPPEPGPESGRAATARDGTASGPGPDVDRLIAALTRRGVRGGTLDEPPPFRAYARSSGLGAGTGAPPGPAISPVSRALLPHMPVDAWRGRRRRNLEILAAEVGPIGGTRLLPSPPGGVAFAFTLVFDAADDRDRARAALVERAVVPSILWPLDASGEPGVGPADADLSRRILSVHCDQRYDTEDMRRLATILRAALDA